MRHVWKTVFRGVFGAVLMMMAGCNGGGSDGSPTASGAGGSPPPPPLVDQNAPPAPPVAGAPGEAPVQLRRTIGQTTDDVRDFNAEMQSGQNVQVSTGKITAKDPITLQGNAYVSIIGQAAVLQIQHAVNLYNALNDRYPADFEEFKREILDANGIRLPQLPAYQEYAYKADTHELVVLEYPDRMEALREQVRGGTP
ncbi:hypothetical protein [Tautonia marina]|uniref:hypothetical protein n=1 Tax=Tautonia marina TaxID=2653855 RepID=UPI0012603E79|nr:hypothetical protein [Tautonia marina]